MSINQHVKWPGSRHQGYVDYGQGGGTDSMNNLSYAKDAFVSMVVGYFFIKYPLESNNCILLS